MPHKNINISDRVANQLPEFIREEDQQFVDFLLQYYKSQEKTGRPYDILNNLLGYLDLDSYTSDELSNDTLLLSDIGLNDKTIRIEAIDGFKATDGSIKIDNEVIYYENVTRGPDAIVTPGVSPAQFDKKKQQLENPFQLFDGTRNKFPLNFLGTPVNPPSVDHLIVVVYNEMLVPGTDYFLEGDEIRFAVAPRERSGADDSAFTEIIYLVGYADQTIVTTDAVPFEEYQSKKEYPLRVNTQPYTPTSAIGLIVKKNNRQLEPYTDYTVYGSEIIFRFPLGGADNIHIRSVEYIAPNFGSGASAVVSVDNFGQVDRLIPKTGGSGYRLDFAPKVVVQHSEGVGATAKTLVSGIKNINLIDGGQGYTSYNPPIALVGAPTGGTLAKVALTVDDVTGQVDSLTIMNSGSGYDFIPAISFANPGGCKIGQPTIDSEGRVNIDSIAVEEFGLNYSNPPIVYLDPAPEGGINAQAISRINQDGQVYEIVITNRGRGYATPPRARIIQPIGAQVLDVTVASGNVTNIEMLTGGNGYTDAPSVYIVDDRKDPYGDPIGGTGATAAATIFNGQITDINITNFGSGYSETEPPKIYIAEPKSARASVAVGFNELTGYEIIERGSGYSPSAFLGCSRGVSGAVGYDNLHNEIYAGEATLRQSTHPAASTVINLDSLFIREVFDKFRRQYLPTIEIDYSSINPIQVIKSITDFYISKGTELSTQYLFKIMFGEQVEIYYPRDEIISPSAATWVVDTVLRAELISGDPGNLIDSQLIQYADPVDLSVKAANALIENVITIIEGKDTIYELAISEETLSGSFIIPYKTTLVEPLTTTGQIITVDSTIGWPERNGTIRINDVETAQYKEKSLNQFIECTRSQNGVVEDWDPGTIVYSDIFVYVNKGTSTECKLRVLGIAEAGTTILEDTGSYYLQGDKLKVAKLGSSSEDERLSSWLYNVKKLIQVNTVTPGGVNNQTATVVCDNPHGLLVSDQVTIYGANPVVFNGTFTVTSRIDTLQFTYQINTPTEIIPEGNILLSVDLNRGKSDINSINSVVSEFTTNIQNSFFNADYVYVASSGLPNYKVGPFTGSALIPGNQRKLLRFPRLVQTISERQDISANTSIGAWVNGVSIWAYKSGDFVRFGPLTGITVSNTGQDYDAGSKPALEITGGGGTGATGEVVVNGSLTSFDVTEQGSGYTESPLVSIVGGGGIGATAQAIVTGGRVTRILVEQPGTGYTSQPSVSVTGGGGTGALAKANVRGPIQSVSITANGSGYTELPSIRVNSGEGALAQPIVINGRIVSIAIINSGSGYTTAPTIIINGDGFGAIARAVIGTIGEDKGRVLSVEITNRGIGYTQGLTTVRLESVGDFAEFTPQVFEWNKNLQYDLATNYDGARGYVFTGRNNQFGGEYAHLSDPKELRYVVGDNVFLNAVTQQFQEVESNYEHSPILGWAYDGNPIYGPYGYIDPTDQNSGIRRLRTSYKLKDNVVYDLATNPNPARVDGPELSSYPAGSFVADYEYDFQSGDLDNYNGRFCKTPQYPDGTYAYFITIDASEAGIAEFPYILGPQFNSLPDPWNFTQGATQENIPQDVVRYRDPYVNVDIDVDRQPNQEADVLTTEIEGYPLIFEIQDSNNDGIIDANEQQEVLEMSEEATLQIYDYFPQVSEESRVDIEVETTTQFEDAQIDGFVIENPGVSYQVNDTIFFDDGDTGGFGASAFIESVKGQSIQSYSKEIIGDRPYGVINTSANHDLRQQDELILNSSPVIDNTNKNFKVKVVSGIERINVTQGGVGYNEDIPPTFELITSAGQDGQLEIVLQNTGQISSVNIINSGNGYDPENPPQIRVSHPQQFKKTRYWLTEYMEADGIINVNDIKVTSQRNTYICGKITETDGDESAFLAKFDDLGQKIWERTLIPTNANQKRAEFLKMVVNAAPENDLIYVTGQTKNPDNDTYNPDIWLGLYESGFNNANDPDGILQWQRAIAGISGSTRRDFVTSIALDQEQRIYLCGYTDTNSVDPDDMWIIQCGIEGDLVEKRKVASQDDSEKMHQIMMISDDRFFFIGVNDQNDDLIFGEFFYDGANLEMDWIKQIPTVGGRVVNPTMVMDDYGAIIVAWDIFNSAASKYDKIQINKFLLSTAQTEWDWSKTVTTAGDFLGMHHAGISYDQWGNYTLVSDVTEAQNQRYSVITYMKYDGTLLHQTKVDDTTNIGFQATTHALDNSGDTILAVNRQQSDQLASWRMGNSANPVEDTTKQQLGTYNYFSQSDITHDAAVYKFDGGSLKFNDVAPITIADLGLTPLEWSGRMWMSMNTTAWNTAHEPTLLHFNDATNTNSITATIKGDNTDPDYQKVILYLNGTQVASSVAATNWDAFAAAAWVHITVQKRQESLGLYRYEVFVGGNQQISYQSTTDVALDDVVICGPVSSPTVANSFRGNIDDFVLDDAAPYSGTSYTVPTSEIAITTSNSDVALIKFDRAHTQRAAYTLTGLSNYSNIAFTDHTIGMTWTSVSPGAISTWLEGPGGLQILDMSQTFSTLIPGTYTLSSAYDQYASKTSTIPSPRGKRLIISADVIPKFYLRDALYQKIDNVQEFTFTQPLKLTQYSILQQFNNVGTTTAFATITEVPAGSLRNPGIGTKYRVGKIFGTFNNTDRFRTTTLGGDINQIEGTYFDTIEEESPWVASTAYAQGDRVYNQKRIYEAQGAGTSGTISPQHNTGVVTDGVINWAFIDDAGKFTLDLTEHPFPRPQYTGLDMPEWLPHRLYAVGQRVWYKLNVYQVAVGGGGVTTPTPPTHTTGDVSDGSVTWSFVETNEAISQYTRLMPYDQGNNYSIEILEVQPGSNFIPNDVVSVNTNNITLAEDEKSVEISGFASVKKIRVTARLEKDILLASSVRTDKVYCTSNSPHFYKEGEIIFAEGFSGAQYNGSFFIDDVIGSREFTFGIRDTAVSDPTFVNNGIANVNIYAKHPTLIFTRNHQYNFELSDPSNFGYYLSFSQDNQYKLEYSFNNTVREGTPGIQGAGASTPFVKFLVLGDVTNISYYFDPSRTGSNSPVGENSYIDVITTPYQGRFRISEIVSDTEFKFPLNREPERNNAEIGSDDQGNEYSYYSTTSTRAVGPINTIKLVSPGGFYKKLPIISDIASFRQIEKVEVIDGGTEYAPGVYYDVPVNGDGEGGKVTVTVLLDDETGSGAISSVAVADPGKGYTVASVDIDAITGILGPTLSGSGGAVSVNIPSEGTGASVFLTGRNIGKIKRLKNNEFGFGYSHDYTLKPEITFPVNLQLFNTSILSEIKITDPGAGYTSTPAVVIDGGGGTGADAVAVIKNNRLNEIIIKNPGAGYSSEPVVTLKSEFNYVVNLDLNYLQFNFPHGITTGAEIQFRSEDVGSTEGILPKPSSAGLTALIAGQVYYAIAGQANSLESDQIRFGLTLQSAQAGDYITFLTQGSGRQVLLTEVFGGKAEAVVATSRFLEGEEVFQGSAIELASATGKVSTNTGWQIGPKILKIVDYDGDWKMGEKVTGSISKASGVIDNMSIARGVLNIGSLTKTPGKFIDNVGKPSEIVQKIQDSFFYQNFSYVIKSEIPITKWKTQILENNHPAGFQLFGQLQLVGGKDVSGRKVGTEFTKEVNINNYSNVNQITSFGAAQPIYTDYNNTEVLFRKKRLTSSEEILTSIVKKLDDISPQFNGIDKQFPITVEGQQVIVQQNQLLITINGVIQAPGVSYTIVGGQIVFGEPPKPASRVNYRSLEITPTVIYRIELYSGQAGPPNFGIFPTLGQQVQGKDSDVVATIIDSGTTHIDVINLVGGSFNLNEEITRGTLFSALVQSVTAINSDTIFQFGESITNLEGDTAIIEETNIDGDGNVTDAIVVSKTSGTAQFETGIFDLRLNEFVYSASSKIAGQITFISPYIDPATQDAVDELIINPGSTFYGLLFERLVSITNPNVIIDNISQSSITPTELYDSSSRINADFLDFEEVRNTEVQYTQLAGGNFSEGDIVINNRANYGNPSSVFHGVATNRFKDASAMILGNKDQIIDFAEAEIAVKHPRFYFPGDIITNSWSRYSDAYRLIQKNKSYIANKAYDEMMTQYTSLTVPDPNKCIRDLELYIDAISIDIFRGGNVYTRKLCAKYFDVDGNFVYVNNESAETRYGFEKAKDMMKLAIVNNLTNSFTVPSGQPNQGITYVPWSEVDHGGYDGNGITADPSPNDPYGTNGANQSNNGTDNCSDVQAAITTLYDVVDETLLNGTLVDLPDESKGTYSPGQIKCRRDIGLMIDALAEDVSQGGNYNIIEFTKKYFDAAGAPIANGLIGEYAESLTAIDKAMHLSFQAINNLLYYQVNSRTSVTGFMLKDPTTYQGSYSGGEDDLQEFDVSAAVYTPSNGQMVLTIGTHSLTTSDTVTIRPHSLKFTCDSDNDASFHDYPRAGDPAFNTPLAISAETGTTITVNVGASPLVQFTPTAATYNPATGDMVLTIGSHSLEINDYVTIANDSLVFTCDMDANGTTHTYPRSTDPASGKRLFIHGADATTITVNVAASPADQQYAHTFVSASANSVSSGGGYTHTFVKGLDNAVFTGGGTTAKYFDPNYYSGRNETIQNCANVQAYIATLVDISTTAIAAQNLNNINALASITDGTFVAGENIRTTKIAYKDRAGGLFIVGDTITGITSGAQFEAIGSNSGLKWIFADAVTGSFQDGEYITNSTTANQNGVSLSVIEKYKRLSGKKSIKFPSTGYLVTKDSYDFSFGNTADFTVQGWFRADNLSTTQHLFDFRRLSATAGLRITLQTSGAITVYNGTSQLLTGGTLLANNWHHVAVVRTTSVLQLYVDGVQVGGNYADTNDYGYAAIYVGADFNAANQFTGYMDNVVVKNGESDFNTGFVPPTQIDYSNQYVKFGLDGEQPFVMDNQETYAIYTGQRISSAAIKELNYDQNFAIIENVDLGRSDHRNCADIIDLNAAWIAEEAVGRMEAAFPDFVIPGNNVAEGSYGGTNKCIRDTKDYIIGALVKDLRDGGNYNSLYTARTYLEASGKLKHVGNEILQTLYAWDQAFVLCKYVITTTDTTLTGTYTNRLRLPNNFATPASQSIQDEFDTLGREVLEVLAPNPDIFRDTGVLVWKNRDYIAEEVAGYILNKYEIDLNGTLTQFLEMPGYGQPYCERDVKQFILPAVIADLCTGGTYNVEAVIDNYLDDQNNILHVEHELNPMLDAFHHAKYLTQKAGNNLLLSPGEVSGDLGIPAWAQDDYHTPLYTSRGAFRDDTIIIDDEGYPQDNVSNWNRYKDATNAIAANIDLIAHEAVETMNDMSKYALFQIKGGPVNCSDDVKDILKALVHDLNYNCNERTWDAANLYVEPENNSLKHIEDDWEATVSVMKIVKDIATITMRNGFGRDYIPGNDPNNVDPSTYEANPKEQIFADCADAIDANIRWIAEQAVKAGQTQYPSLSINGGIYGGQQYTPSDATYIASSGEMVITMAGHGLVTGNRVTVRPDSIGFTCTLDGNNVTNYYPRKGDPAYTTSRLITAHTTDTITINVGASPAGEQYTHTFVNAHEGAVVSNGSIDCVHDVTDILRALVFNLKYDGDNWINWVSEFYTTYSGSLAHVTSLATEVNWILEEAKRLVKRAMRGQIITNVASYSGGVQAFSEAVPKPTTVLRNSLVDEGITLGGDYNNVVTRTFTNGTNNIASGSASATGITNDEDLVCSCVTVLPAGTPSDGVLWELGGNGAGAFIGIRDSGTYLRLRAGNGANSYAGGASTASDNGLALLDVQVSTLSDYFDGGEHEITWEIRVGGTVASGSGRVKLWIDGNLIGEASTPGLNTGLYEAGGLLAGGSTGGFATMSSDSTVPQGEPTASWAYTTGDMSYYRSRLVDPIYTGSESDNVATEVDTLMQLVTDAISNPADVTNRVSILPKIWPIKYTPDIAVRDTGLTYDSSAAEWNQTCAEVASAIDTLLEIYIDTIENAANNNTNQLDSIVRTTRLDAYTNSNYQQGTCEGPQSAIDTLFDIMVDTLGAGLNTDKSIANMLLFNKDAIAQRAFDETVTYYGTTEMTVDFCADILKAVRYDMITGGNAGAFRLVQNWFDGEGNFIAFQDIARTHLIYANTRVREYIKSVLYQLTEDPGWTTYNTYQLGIDGRLDYNREASEFIIDSSINAIEYSLETSKFPTEGSVTWVPSSDAVNINTKYELGYDYNTDPALVTLTPIVPVGFDRAEYRVRINRVNSFRRGDILQYIPASETSVAAFTGQTYWYVMTATAQWFEVGAHYMHDGRFRRIEVNTANTGQQIFSVVRRTGIDRSASLFPADPSQTPIQGGFNPADVIYGTTSESSSEVGSISLNQAEINRLYTRYNLNNVSQNLGVYENFQNGEQITVQSNPAVSGIILQSDRTDNDGLNFVNLTTVAGVINVGDILVGADSGTTAEVTSFDSRMLINVERGSFAQGDWLFDKASATEAYANTYLNKSGSLTGNDGGRITIDVETIGDAWDAGDIIYGSVTDYILEIKGLSGTQIQLNQYIHGTNIYQLELGTAIVDTGISDTFRVGDEVVLLQGTTLKDPGFRATVTEYINGINADPADPNYGIHRLFIGNLIPIGTGEDITALTIGSNNIGKLDLGSNFPSIYANVTSVIDTTYNSYGRVAAIDQQGITATVWLENVKGDFLNNMTVVSDYGWGGVVAKARTLEGRVDRYFRGFDGSQTQFDLTISNGEAYFPDPAGHMLIFVNGILQPPGGNNSYVAFSDKINFSEAPDIGSEFVGYYVGKLRQMDDISFEFDSLRSSFNLRREGLFYSLTLTEGVSSNVIRPENNIIVSLNGIIQEPGVAYEIVGSRIIFAEVPRAGSTFVGFSYIGSDTDVIAATVVPPVEAGDKLEIDGEEFARDVALIESSNSLITFEYTGSVKGRNAAALATIRSGQLNSAILTNSGDGYTSRPNVDVISSSGFDGRIKALMGITRIDVKTPGVSYLQPLVEIDNIVPDDFVNPSGTPVNGGRDIYNADEAIDGDTTTITPGAIAISQDPVNVTVNQGQTASFTVAATVSNSQQLNYQWQKKEYGTQTWSNIIGANQSTFNTNDAAQADDGDEYRVAITAAGATPVYSLSAILTVQTGATVISNFTPDQIFDDI